MNTENPQHIQEENEINLRQYIEQYAYYWKWFILSVVVFLAGAFLYLRYAPKIYNVQAKILLEDEKSGAGDMAGLSELLSVTGGGSQASAFVSDQIDVMKSRRILTKVANNNRLNIVYNSKGKIMESELLESESPVKVILLDEDNPKLDSLTYTFRLTPKDNGQVKFSDKEQIIDQYVFGEKINTPVGAIMLMPQKGRKFESELEIDIVPIEKVVDGLLTNINITPNGKEKQSYIVNLSMNHTNRKKAALIINSVIEQYDLDAKEDKLKLTKATSEFINNRLALITKDLSQSDSKVATYKDQNNLIDMRSEVQMYMESAADNERKLIEYQTQLRLADMMRESVTDEMKLLPSNIGLTDPSIEATIRSYNELVLEREDLLKSATPDNPIVKNLDKNINEVKKNLISSLQNYRNVLQTNVGVIQEQTSKYTGKLGSFQPKRRIIKIFHASSRFLSPYTYSCCKSVRKPRLRLLQLLQT